MQIESFDQNQNRTVILHMIEMPPGMKAENTSITIAGVAQDPPSFFDLVEQQIGFTASPDAQEGKIAVLASLDDGRQVTAISAEDYWPKHDDPDPNPRGSSLTPQSAKPGDRVTIRGRSLSRVYGVLLGTIPVPARPQASDYWVKFGVPNKIEPGRYQVKIKFDNREDTPTIIPTALRLEVTKKEG